VLPRIFAIAASGFATAFVAIDNYIKARCGADIKSNAT